MTTHLSCSTREASCSALEPDQTAESTTSMDQKMGTPLDEAGVSVDGLDTPSESTRAPAFSEEVKLPPDASTNLTSMARPPVGLVLKQSIIGYCICG